MLNEHQKQAVNCKSSRILCMSGAGTGKTFTMLKRIERIIEDGADPRSILVLTFTRAAAFEMRNRYLQNNECTITPEFRTFHSFCYNLIYEDAEIRRALGYYSIPSIAQDGQTKEIKNRAMAQLGLKLSDKKYTEMIHSDSFEGKVLAKAVRREMIRQNVITYDELSNAVSTLFKENKGSIQKYKNWYKYIFVDEFQDTDSIQNDFIQSFSNSDIFLIGDVLQNLYSFRGTSNKIMKAIADDPEWTVLSLSSNYRSGESICRYANQISTMADSKYRIELHSFVDFDGVVEEVSIDDRYGNMAEQFNYIAKKLPLAGSTAILARTNREVDAIRSIFLGNGIKCNMGSKSDRIVNILRSAFSDLYMISWLSTFLNSENYSQYIRLVSTVEDEKKKLEAFYTLFNNNVIVDSKIRQITAVRRIFNQDISAVDKFKFICNELHIQLNELENLDTASNMDIAKYIVAKTSDDAYSDIYIGTIHSSKGLEYDNVFLLDVNTQVFRIDSEDAINLLYVGATRARKYLCVFEYDFGELI